MGRKWSAASTAAAAAPLPQPPAPVPAEAGRAPSSLPVKRPSPSQPSLPDPETEDQFIQAFVSGSWTATMHSVAESGSYGVQVGWRVGVVWVWVWDGWGAHNQHTIAALHITHPTTPPQPTHRPPL